MTKNFEVRKHESGKGWDIVDTRRGGYPIPVDYEHYKKDAIERAKLWNEINPQLKGSK